MARDYIGPLIAALLLASVMPGAATAAIPSAKARNTILTARVLDPEIRAYRDRDPLSVPLPAGVAGDVLPVRSQLGNWVEIELPDGSTGWIVAKHVAVRPARSLLGTSGEIAGALAGTVVGGAATALLLSGTIALADPFDGLFERVHGSGSVSQTALLLALSASATSSVLTPAAAACGAYLAGERSQPGGNLLTSWVYAAGGGALGCGLGYGIDACFSGLTQGACAGIGLLVGTTAGAVIGYENSRPPYARQYRFAQRVMPPAVGLATGSPIQTRQSASLRIDVVRLRL